MRLRTERESCIKLWNTKDRRKGMKEQCENAGGKGSDHGKFVVLMKRDGYNFFKFFLIPHFDYVWKINNSYCLGNIVT